MHSHSLVVFKRCLPESITYQILHYIIPESFFAICFPSASMWPRAKGVIGSYSNASPGRPQDSESHMAGTLSEQLIPRHLKAPSFTHAALWTALSFSKAKWKAVVIWCEFHTCTSNSKRGLFLCFLPWGHLKYPVKLLPSLGLWLSLVGSRQRPLFTSYFGLCCFMCNCTLLSTKCEKTRLPAKESSILEWVAAAC